MAYQFTNVARECKAFGKASTRLVLMILASCADKDGVCYPSYACLMHWAKLSRSTLAEALKELEESGVLHRHNRYRRSNVYTLNIAKLEELRAPFTRPASKDDQESTEPSLDYYEICELVNALSGNTERGAEGRTHLEDVAGFVEMQKDSAQAVAVLRWFLELKQRGDSNADLDFSPAVKSIKKWEQLVKHYSELAEYYDRANPRRQELIVPPWGNKNVCEKSQHQWDEYTHAVERCAVCGEFRCNPIAVEWTAADDSEAEYEERVEFDDPCEPYFTGAAELPPMPTEKEDTISHLSDVEQILHRLDQKARFAFYNGYGVMQLMFSDGSSVSRVDLDRAEVAALLRTGARPLGFIAPLRDRFGLPLTQTWNSGDEQAEASLRASAHLRYGHRMGAADARVSS